MVVRRGGGWGGYAVMKPECCGVGLCGEMMASWSVDVE